MMRPFVTAAAAIATIACLIGTAAAQKSTRHHRLAATAAPKPSKSALAQKSWEPARAWGSFIVAIATPAKSDPGNLPNHRCSGVLITRQHVLASGYCVGDGKDESLTVAANTLEVYVGTKVDPGSKPLAVAAVFRHQDYDPLTFRGDLTILKLAEPVAGPLETIGLSTAPQASIRSATNAGWMQDDTGDRQIIMRMTIPPVSPDRCEAIMRDQRLAAAQDNYVGVVSSMNVPPDVAMSAWKALTKAMPDVLTQEMLCAGPADGMPCDVDAGSLLLTTAANGKPELLGVFSNLPVCEVPGIPAVYTRVAPYAAWINDTVKK